jgi:hypothetical protein
VKRCAWLIGITAVNLAWTAHAALDFDYGNPLVERQYASDCPSGLGAAPFLVMPPAVLPEGTLNSFKTWNQLEPGDSPFPSAGNFLTAYILRPTGTADQFTVVFSTDVLTIPEVAKSGFETFTVAPFLVQAGDRIAFHGQGVPLDEAGTTDTVMYPVAPAPTVDKTFTVDSPGYRIYKTGTYSFAANVTPVPEASTYLAGLGGLVIAGLSIWRNRR